MRHVDGLRALAVLPMIFFHAEIAIFGGGFVGVDVFFVISGYLITGLIQRDLTLGSFSYHAFLERQARRIFPALTVVVVLSSITAWILLLPGEMKNFTESVFASTFL